MLLVASVLPAVIGVPLGVMACIWLVAVSRAAAFIYTELFESADTERLITPALRLLAANALLVFFFSLVSFILGLFLIIFSVILVVVSGYDPSSADPGDVNASLDALRASGAIWLLYLAMLAGAFFYVWLMLRLILVGAATFRERRLMIFRTWDWTKGRVRDIFTTALCTWIPASVVAVVATLIAPPQFQFVVFGLCIVPAFCLFHLQAALALQGGPSEMAS